MLFYINILAQKINEIILEGLFLSGSNNKFANLSGLRKVCLSRSTYSSRSKSEDLSNKVKIK